MPTELVVSLVLMTCHDFLYYISQDYGAIGRPANVIGNFALMYSINRQASDTRRLLAGNTPYYAEDLPRMQVYATPASFVDDFPYYRTSGSSRWISKQMQLGGTMQERWPQASPVMITWNSTGESLLDKMEQDNINMPKVGAYYRHPPLTSFYFYCVGTPIPNVIRIGKKYICARISAIPLDATLKTGVFQPTCPVTVSDLPSSTKIISGSLLTIPPAPVLVASELEGSYLESTDKQGIVHRFPVPKKELYRTSWGWEAG
jgi:CRISPR type I-D-associated protein Csc1